VTMLAAGSQDVLLATLLLDLAIVAGCALAFGALARRIGQAVVVGEIVAGLLLGPSLLGLLPGNLDALLFPHDVRPYLQMLANVALVLFMFGIGFEVDIERLRRSGRAALRVAAASVLVPLVAAVAIAPALWAVHPPVVGGVSAIQFAAFLGIVLSVTALPVLARVLADARLLETPLGSLALVIAAMTDLVAWLALAALTATLGATHGGMSIGGLLLALAGFLALLLLVIRPLLRWGLAAAWCERHGPAGASLLLLVTLALCAAATTQLGLHPVFGAFALGVACPRRCIPWKAAGDTDTDTAPSAPVPDPSQHVASAAHTLSGAGLVLVPLYFIVTGLKVDVTSLGLEGALEVCCLLVVATASKVVGVTWAALRSGLARGRSLGLGLLLNTRGLTELIVLDIGHSAGVIDDRLFTVLILVALLTTAMTMPCLPLALRIGRDAPRICQAGQRLSADRL
jgi:Kef-type K+ transport system membrane component KefB